MGTLETGSYAAHWVSLVVFASAKVGFSFLTPARLKWNVHERLGIKQPIAFSQACLDL